MSEVCVSMPVQLPSELLKAVRVDPLTSMEDKEEMHARIGWLICAYEVMVKAQTEKAQNHE